MKLLKHAIPIAVLLAVIVVVTACNRHDETLAPVDDASLLTMAFVPAVEVTVDIVPHKPSNQVNCTAKNRLLAVAIITTNAFDAMTVDHATVEFEGAYEAHIDPDTGEPVRHEIDVDEDGDMDLVLHFLLNETNLACESTEGCLTGETFDDVPIYGCDFIYMFWR